MAVKEKIISATPVAFWPQNGRVDSYVRVVMKIEKMVSSGKGTYRRKEIVTTYEFGESLRSTDKLPNEVLMAIKTLTSLEWVHVLLANHIDNKQSKKKMRSWRKLR